MKESKSSTGPKSYLLILVRMKDAVTLVEMKPVLFKIWMANRANRLSFIRIRTYNQRSASIPIIRIHSKCIHEIQIKSYSFFKGVERVFRSIIRTRRANVAKKRKTSLDMTVSLRGTISRIHTCAIQLFTYDIAPVIIM